MTRLASPTASNPTTSPNSDRPQRLKDLLHLKQRIDKRADPGCRGKYQQQAESKQNNHHRNEPPQLALTQEHKELPEDPRIRGYPAQPCHHFLPPSLCITKR